jgi:SAM-dependent methyltransferase
MTTDTALENHYASQGLRQRLDAALQDAGLGSGHIEWTRLVALDQFHSRGLEASQELAHALAPKAEDTVLDLGSGFGGPARFLAATVGCHVTGIELTGEYVAISNYLTERAGLADRVRFIEGDAAQLPFDDESFDHAWTIHVAMNIADKEGFYRGVHRVLRSGGRFAIYDIVRGENEPVIYPTPWSPTPEFSFLASAAETAELIKGVGFTEVLNEDDTAPALDNLVQIANASAPDPNAPRMVTLPQVIGPQLRPMLMNIIQNFQEGRTRVLRAVFCKN